MKYIIVVTAWSQIGGVSVHSIECDDVDAANAAGEKIKKHLDETIAGDGARVGLGSSIVIVAKSSQSTSR